MALVRADFSLGLDDVDGSEEPRRLLGLPCKSLLAYGGDDGTITCLDETSKKFHTVQRFDDGVRAVAVSEDGKRIAVGFDSGEIQLFHYDDFETDTTGRHPFAEIKDKVNDNDLLSQGLSDCHKVSVGGPQFASPIRDLQFLRGLSSAYWLIIAHESGMSIVDVTSKEAMSRRLLEREIKDAHGQCGIRGVCHSLESSQIATLSMDGKLCLWDVDLTDPKLPSITLSRFETKRCITKHDVGEIHGADACERSYRPELHGDMLATPGQLTPLVHHIGNGCRIMEVESCENNRHVEPVVSLAFLSNGLLISSGRDRRIVLWKCDTKKFALLPIASAASSSVVTAFKEREGGSIYAACTNGSCLQLDLKNCFVEREQAEDPDSLRCTKSELNEISIQSKTADDEAEFDILGDQGKCGTDIGPGEEIKNMEARSDHMASEDEDEDEAGDVLASHNMLLQMPREENPQPPFSVSSTPLDLARRYLCWNHIGSMTIHNASEDANQRSTVDISFTDSAYKRPVSFTDNIGFIVGSLGEDGAIFASDLQNDDDDDLDERNLGGLQMSEETFRAVKRSQRKRNKHDAKPTGSGIFFYRFETLGALRDKDWFLSLPNGERVLGSACGSGWAAVATSRRYLRLFSSGGNQEQIAWLNGDPVTLAGRSRFLIVFCHRARPLVDKTQQLDYVLWDVGSFTVISQGPLTCLGKGASLSWAGFSSDCAPMVMDSDGMLSMLAPCSTVGRNWQWIPVLDTLGLRKSTEDNFWPITVQDGRLVCVPLKGGSMYPDAARRPITTTLGLRMPLATSSPSRFSVLEELSVRSNLALSQKRALEMGEDEVEYIGLCAQVDKVTLKLFAGMMDEGKVERALDLVGRLHLPKSYEIAARMAEHNRKLADLIEDAKLRCFQHEASDSLDDGTTKPRVSNSGSPNAGDKELQFVTPVSNLQKRSNEDSNTNIKKARIF